MTRFLNLLVLLLVGCIGLHLQKSVTLLYFFSVCVIGLVLIQNRKSLLGCREWIPTQFAASIILLFLFSVLYVAGMLFWRFWLLPANALDAANALMLPVLMLIVGFLASTLGRAWATRVLLAYAVGALIYVLAALALSRHPWWDVGQVFDLVIRVPWGSTAQFNVRSVEQNAYPSLMLLPVAVLILIEGRPSRHLLFLSIVFLVFSLLGWHSMLSLNGRLGWLALLLTCLPVAAQIAFGLAYRRHNQIFILSASALVIALILTVAQHQLHGGQHINIWSQGLCDERLGYHVGLLKNIHIAPWGGRILQIPYHFCGEQRANGLLAQSGGTVDMAHNVFLDIFFSVGILPSLLLLASVAPPLVLALKGFCSTFPRWDWQGALRWGWICLLMCQWMFQPLLYSDGLLYYLTFFVLGLIASESGGTDFSLRAERPLG